MASLHTFFLLKCKSSKPKGRTCCWFFILHRLLLNPSPPPIALPSRPLPIPVLFHAGLQTTFIHLLSIYDLETWACPFTQSTDWSQLLSHVVSQSVFLCVSFCVCLSHTLWSFSSLPIIVPLF